MPRAISFLSQNLKYLCVTNKILLQPRMQTFSTFFPF